MRKERATKTSNHKIRYSFVRKTSKIRIVKLLKDFHYYFKEKMTENREIEVKKILKIREEKIICFKHLENVDVCNFISCTFYFSLNVFYCNE